jgi:antibiotic biosynthesis monooxygenase (ABM) superfamily enzyme
MWAQIIKARIKPGKEAEIRQLESEFEARSGTQNNGWIKSIGLRNQNDPSEYFDIVFFESEERARANEQSPEQNEMYARLQSMFDGAPQFTDCEVVYESGQ